MRTPGERLPRFKRKPAAIPNFEITPRDEEIIRIVARHRFIRSYHIIDLLTARDPSTSEQKITRRLQLLFHGGYLSRPSAQVDTYRAGAGSRPMVFILGNKGIALLAAKYGFRRSSADWTTTARTATRIFVEHALEVTDFMVALALACSRRGQLEVMYFDEIMRELAPDETRKNPQPYHWPVSVRPIPDRWQGREAKTHYAIPDKIFGIRNLDRPEGRNRTFFFLEADRGTMPVVRPGLDKSSLLRKLVLYGFTHEDGLHRKYYGLPNFRVLTVVPRRQRINTILAAHKQHTARLVPAALCLFADRRGLLDGADFFAYQWLDAAGEPHRLLD
jgi:Replication-relaxation